MDREDLPSVIDQPPNSNYLTRYHARFHSNQKQAFRQIFRLQGELKICIYWIQTTTTCCGSTSVLILHYFCHSTYYILILWMLCFLFIIYSFSLVEYKSHEDRSYCLLFVVCKTRKTVHGTQLVLNKNYIMVFYLLHHYQLNY